jgi:hypothetical protein
MICRQENQAQKQVVLTLVLYSFGHRTGHIRKIDLFIYFLLFFNILESLGLRGQVLVFEIQILEEIVLGGERSQHKATVVTEFLVLLTVFGKIILVHFGRRPDILAGTVGLRGGVRGRATGRVYRLLSPISQRQQVK